MVCSSDRTLGLLNLPVGADSNGFLGTHTHFSSTTLGYADDVCLALQQGITKCNSLLECATTWLGDVGQDVTSKKFVSFGTPADAVTVQMHSTPFQGRPDSTPCAGFQTTDGTNSAALVLKRSAQAVVLDMCMECERILNTDAKWLQQ